MIVAGNEVSRGRDGGSGGGATLHGISRALGGKARQRQGAAMVERRVARRGSGWARGYRAQR